MQKNFLIKKTSKTSRKSYRKEPAPQDSNQYSLSKATISSTQNYSHKEIERQLKYMWSLPCSMNLDISEEGVIKYMRKAMERQKYHFTEYIIESFKNCRGNKLLEKNDEINYEQVLIEVDKLKAEVESFLWRKFCKDIEIMENKIQMADQLIRNSLELTEYQNLTASFRPFLISNPSNLIQQFQNVRGPSKRNGSKLQQMRYQKLNSIEQVVCNMHSFVCQSKQDVTIFTNT